MDTRVALIQYDARGAVLQASTCFVSAAPASHEFIRDLLPQLRCLWLRDAEMVEAVVDADAPVLRIDRSDVFQCAGRA